MTFLVVATRIHLDKATTPPSNLLELVQNFSNVCRECQRSSNANMSDSENRTDDDDDDTTGTVVVGVIAVDSTERIAGYNLVEAVQTAVAKVASDGPQSDASSPTTTSIPALLTVLPVQPWGKFVPALNALVSWAAMTTAATITSSSSSSTDSIPSHNNNTTRTMILFCSAETKVSFQAVSVLRSHMDNETLVCGAVLPGHDFQGESTVSKATAVTTELNGRTTPWNTLALWNLSKLALTGFQTVSDGLRNPSMAGVEEVVAIAVLQRILGKEHTLAKLIRIPHSDTDTDENLQWNPTFSDPSRQAWHEQKMQSKLERAHHQMELMGLEGIVHHC